MNEALFKTVKRKIRRGYPEGELRNELRKQGIGETEINEMFDSITKSDTNVGYESASQPEQARMLAAACLAITGMTLLSFNPGNNIAWLLVLTGIAFLLPFIFKKISKEFKRD